MARGGKRSRLAAAGGVRPAAGRRHRPPWLAAGMLWLAAAGPAAAQTFEVTTTADGLDAAAGDGVCADAVGACSLRAAVIEANALPGRQAIVLPGGTYVLGRAGAHEDASLTGDLDIRDDLDITGAGAEVTFIDAAAIDRVIDIAPGAGAASVSMTDVTVTGGSLPGPGFDSEGGGIRIGVRGALEFSDGAVSGNSARHVGGGIVNRGYLVMRRSRIENNSLEGGQGAGLAIGGSEAAFAWLLDTTVRGNQGAGRGGAIASFGGFSEETNAFGRLLVERSALTGNTDGNGVAFYAQVPGTFILRNSTVSGNQGNQGGAFFIDNACMTRIEFSTITGNSASFVGGIVNVHGSLEPFLYFEGSVFADNTPDNCSGPAPQSGGRNLVHVLGGTCNWTPAAGDLLDVPAQLGPLQTPVDGTPHHEPEAGSPLLDAAGGICPATDQRGFARPADGDGDGDAACDIGAIERAPSSSAPTRPPR